MFGQLCKNMSMASQIKYAAVLHNVNEVSLLGTADLEYWRRRLEPEQLEPVTHEGHAQLLIIAADARFMGLRFRELSFGISARDTSGLTNLSGSYLIRALTRVAPSPGSSERFSIRHIFMAKSKSHQNRRALCCSSQANTWLRVLTLPIEIRMSSTN
jgi:hypothetical protein